MIRFAQSDLASQFHKPGKALYFGVVVTTTVHDVGETSAQCPSESKIATPSRGQTSTAVAAILAPCSATSRLFASLRPFGHLKQHLQAKLQKSKEAEAIQQRLLKNGGEIASHARKLLGLITPIQALAKSDGPASFAGDLAKWSGRLTALAKSLGTIEDVMGHKADWEAGWITPPASLGGNLLAVAADLKAKPDQSASVAAQTFLTLAPDRHSSWRKAQRADKQAAAASTRGQDVYKAYCDAMEEQLGRLYAAVEGDFSTFYRDINGDDEAAFKAKLEPSEGKLDLEVAFYDKGMFAPAAYHSEGHQDGMGVCLYLALMKRVLGDRLRFALLPVPIRARWADAVQDLGRSAAAALY